MNIITSNKAVGQRGRALPSGHRLTMSVAGPLLIYKHWDARNPVPTGMNRNQRRDDAGYRSRFPVSHMYMQRDPATLTNIL